MWGKQLFAAALVFGVGITIAFAESPTQSDVSSWKTYRNETMGFETRYLRNWHLRTGKGTAPETVLVEETPQVGKPHLAVQFWIQRQANPQALSIGQWYADQLRAMKAVPPPTTNTSISGRPAVRMEAVGTLGRTFQFLTSLNKKDIFEITITEPSSQTQLDRTYQDIVPPSGS
jgi:hypothetical protein